MGENEFDPNAIPETAEQAEELINHWQSGGETDEQAASEESEKPEVVDPVYEINYRGKKESYPVQKLIEFAQQGRDYAEKMGSFKRDRSTFEEQRTKWQSQYDQQKQALEEYSAWKKQAESNPGWLEHVRQTYQQSLQEQSHRSPNDPFVQKLASTVEELSGTVSEFKQKEMQTQQAKEDQELGLEINDYKSKYPDLAWGDVDENGFDLEQRILDHAMKNKIQTFRAAANDYLFDEHLKRAKLGGKEEVGKSIQKATKLGLGPPTKTPTLKPKRVENVGSKSWEDVHREAMAAFGEG
jgi:hypothetical protein